MNNQSNLVTWLAILVVGLGIVAIVAMTLQSSPEPVALPTKAPATDTPSTPSPTPTETPLPAIALPSPTYTPIPLELPPVATPEGGRAYLLTPASSGAVGWARSGDDRLNHFGDFNIYAGIYDGQVHIGAFQFDLSEIPPGTPILYADLTLMGLSDEFLASQGTWSVQMLEPWLNSNWARNDYHWLARQDSAALSLVGDMPASELKAKKSNTFVHSLEALPLLEASLYQGTVSYRVMGPQAGDNDLFSWDSGFGAGSLARPPLLRIVAGPSPDAPPPSPTPWLVIVPPQSGESLLAMAAERMTATAQATPYAGEGTPSPIPTETSLPPNWVTPVIITNTPVPENGATQVWHAQVATAQAVVLGTPTPLPVNIWTATPTAGPTPTRDLIPFSDLTATPTPTVTPTGIPPVLSGKILFRSDRLGNKDGDLMVMDADGSNVAVWSAGAAEWIDRQAIVGHDLSPDGRFQVLVSKFRIDALPDQALDNFELFVAPTDGSGMPQQLTQLTELKGMSYDAVWSPVDYRIAFVSTSSGGDEIYTIRPDGSELTRLTFNDWEWDKHPSWSPDGTQIVFWSNRDTARRQIWRMNADGSQQVNLSNNEYNDWDPVWVR